MEPDPPPRSTECSHPPANVYLGQQFGINVVATYGQHKKYISCSCTSSGRYIFSLYHNIIILNTKETQKHRGTSKQKNGTARTQVTTYYSMDGITQHK
jgi:hypothetical protein